MDTGRRSFIGGLIAFTSAALLPPKVEAKKTRPPGLTVEEARERWRTRKEEGRWSEKAQMEWWDESIRDFIMDDRESFGPSVFSDRDTPEQEAITYRILQSLRERGFTVKLRYGPGYVSKKPTGVVISGWKGEDE
jgi:hypothetical protein